MTEFKLSDKRKELFEVIEELLSVKDAMKLEMKLIEQDKEFIRLLKEEFDKNRSHHEGYIRKVIDKLAGDLEWMKYSKK